MAGPPAEEGACCAACAAQQAAPIRPASARRTACRPRRARRSDEPTTGGSPSAVCSSRRASSPPRWSSPPPSPLDGGSTLWPADPPRPRGAAGTRRRRRSSPSSRRPSRGSHPAPPAVRIRRDRAHRRWRRGGHDRRVDRLDGSRRRSAAAPTSSASARTAVAAFVPLRRAIGLQRRPVPLAYAAALADVAVGVALATAMVAGWAPVAGAWAALKPAHAWLNVFGFLSIVVAATLIHLAPTVVGARIEPRRSATIALVGLGGGCPTGGRRVRRWLGCRRAPRGGLRTPRGHRPRRPCARRCGEPGPRGPATSAGIGSRPRASSPPRSGSWSRTDGRRRADPLARRVPARLGRRRRRRPPRAGLDRPGHDRLLDPPDPGDRAGRPARARRLAPPARLRWRRPGSWPGTPGSPRSRSASRPGADALRRGRGHARRREPPDRPGAARRGPAAARGPRPRPWSPRAPDPGPRGHGRPQYRDSVSTMW